MRVKNWDKFQHFKDRKPPWIKLYRDLLDDVEWHELDPFVAKQLVMLWLIASEDNGNLPPMKKLAFRLRISEKEAETVVSQLSHWLERDDIEMISGRHQDDAPETEREAERETERETEEEAERAEARAAGYAFHGKVIKLNEQDLRNWIGAYKFLDIPAELTARDAWLASSRAKDADRKNWFLNTSSHLLNKNREAKIKHDTARDPPQRKAGYVTVGI